MASQYKTIHPVKYLRDFLAQEVRPDGRQFLSFRPVSVNVSSITQADSSAIFKIGNTTIVCGIKAELAVPKAESPDCGFIVPNVELPPLCSPKFRPGPPSEQAQVISKLIETILLNSAAVDFKDLCICKDKLAWVLYCDLICIDYDGSVLDACTGALMTALKTLTLPEVSYNMETSAVKVHAVNRVKFPVYALPVCVTFAVFDDQLLIVDPTDEEESLSLSTISIIMDENELCCFHKSGGIPVTMDVITKTFAKSKKRADKIRSLINTAIQS